MSAREPHPHEARRQAVQAALDAAKSAAERNRLGQFATPNALAVDIARYVQGVAGRRLHAVSFADPAIGTGSFFSATLQVWGADRVKNAVGIELDPRFRDAACELWAGAGLRVLPGDFTRLVASSDRPPAPNLILANPPYVRHHHLNRQEKERLQAVAQALAGVRVNGLAGLYVYFLLLATAWMEEDGYAAWLIPSEFMDVQYGRALKHYLADAVTLLRLHRFDPANVQFGDALVSSVIVVFRKAAPPANHAVQFSFGGTLEQPEACEAIPLSQVRTARKWTVYPAHARNDRRLSTGGGPTLRELFRIQRGIATGSNKFFVLDRAEAERRGLPAHYLRPILPSPRRLKTTVIDAEVDGYPRLEPQLLPRHARCSIIRWEHESEAESSHADRIAGCPPVVR